VVGAFVSTKGITMIHSAYGEREKSLYGYPRPSSVFDGSPIVDLS